MNNSPLLLSLYLGGGEVTKLGQFPAYGTSNVDVYEGIYMGRERVAVKVVRAVNSSKNSQRRFDRKAHIWSEIWKIDQEKYILPFYGFGNDKPFPFMVSPWQENGAAIQFVKNNTAVDHIVKGIADSLRVLHTMMPSVVHGDIKGISIMINSERRPLIADFGLSKIIEDITGTPFTQSHGVSESYRWFAPEVE